MVINNKTNQQMPSPPDQLNAWEKKDSFSSFMRSILVAFGVVAFFVCGAFVETPTSTSISTHSLEGEDESGKIKYELYLQCVTNNRLVMHVDFEDTLGLPDTKYYPGTATSVQISDRKSLWIQVKGNTIWNGLLEVPSDYCVQEKFSKLEVEIICKSTDNCVQIKFSSTPELKPYPEGEDEPGKIKYEIFLQCKTNNKLILHVDFEDTLGLPDTKYYPSSGTSVAVDDRRNLWIQVKGKIIWNDLLEVPRNYCRKYDSAKLAIKVICRSSDNCELIKYY